MRVGPVLLIAFLVSVVGLAGQPPGVVRGQTIFVVALRSSGDTRALVNCRVGPPRAVAGPTYPGPELLPAAAADLPGGVPDPDLRAEVERVLRAQKRLAIAPSVERADLVLVIQGDYAPVFTATMPGQPRAPTLLPSPPPPLVPWSDSPTPSWPAPEAPGAAPVQRDAYIGAGQPDVPPNTRLSLEAIVVPAAVYRKAPSDTGALLQARLWEGWEVGVNASAVRPDNLVRSIAGSRERIYWPSLPHGEFKGAQAVCLAPVPPRAAPVPAEPVTAPAVSADRPAPGVIADASAPSANAAATFRTGVDAVAVPTTVEDGKGRSVTGLTARDFRVFEDDAERRVEAVLAGDEPLSVALVLDTSPSMRARIAEIRSAAAAFVEALGPDDRVMVVSFNSRPYIGCELTRDRDEIRRAILQARAGGSITRLYDTLEAVVTERLDRVPRRKAVVLLTDGVDVGSGFASAAAVTARFQSSNVPVFALRYDTRGDARPGPPTVMPRGTVTLAVPSGLYYQESLYEAAASFLADIGQASGGRVDVAATPDEIVAGFGRIAAELRRQYVLYYYSPDARAEGLHRIRVEVGRPDVVVRHRTIYRAPR